MRIRWNRSSSNTSNHSLYQIKLLSCPCFPERNFGRNQLPNCSMSLSPLYPTLTRDLHVITVGDLPSKFPLTSINSGIIHNLSGPRTYTYTRFTSQLLIIQLWFMTGIYIICTLYIYFHFVFMIYHHFHSHIYQTPRSVFQDETNLTILLIRVDQNLKICTKAKIKFIKFHSLHTNLFDPFQIRSFSKTWSETNPSNH